MTIEAKTKKIGDYYKACLVVKEKTEFLPSGWYVQNYYSRDVFTSKAIAKKHAEFWRKESLELGQITYC